jgi:hypothetical protein
MARLGMHLAQVSRDKHKLTVFKSQHARNPLIVLFYVEPCGLVKLAGQVYM